MKHAIIQYFLEYNGVGKLRHYKDVEGIPDWADRSVNYFKNYADYHDADHFFFTDRYIDAKSNYFEGLRLIHDPMFEQYDKVLYADVDVMPKCFSKSVFDIDVIDVAGWPEWRHPDITGKPSWSASPAIRKRFSDFGSKIVKPTSISSNMRMINTGVVLWSQQARIKARKFDHHDKWFNHNNVLLDRTLNSRIVGHSSHCLDQPYLNAMWNKFDFDVTELGIEWNRFPTKSEDRECNFAHYVGDHRYQITKLFPEIKDED